MVIVCGLYGAPKVDVGAEMMLGGYIERMSGEIKEKSAKEEKVMDFKFDIIV